MRKIWIILSILTGLTLIYSIVKKEEIGAIMSMILFAISTGFSFKDSHLTVKEKKQ